MVMFQRRFIFPTYNSEYTVLFFSLAVGWVLVSTAFLPVVLQYD